MKLSILKRLSSGLTFRRFLVPKDERKPCAYCGGPARFIYRWDQGNVLSQKYLDEREPQFCSRACHKEWQR